MKIWHPFTQEKTADKPLKIVKAENEYLFDDTGKKYIDMVSSWWVNTLGHANKEIAEAIYNQATTLEHVIFAGFSHDPAEKLCDELSKFLPPELSKFFFSDNGSTAVEVALKIAYQYFKNKNVSGKNIFINLEGAYHGDTLGAMSVAGNNSKYHSTFSEFFFQTFSIDFPKNKNEEDIAIEKLNMFLKENNEKVCALIIEPLIQGAAGMRVYPHDFLEKIVNSIRKYDILVIFDEVMTGFFRTGTMFALNQISVVPDIICISKGITGGFMPLSLTITTDKIYKEFLSDDWKKAFIHGHSYTANPLACAAACKALEIIQREDVQKNIHLLSKYQKENLNQLKGVSNKRHIGVISAFEVESPIIAKQISKNMMEKGIIIRPIENTIYLIPPYCISKENLNYVYTTLQNFFS